MLAGVYYGAQYGGSTTAILLALPGEASSAVTMIDGHKMAQQGRAGVALATAALSSFFAGCIGTLLLAVFAIPISLIALNFGPAELFSLMAVGLIGAAAMSRSSIAVSVGLIVIGILFGLVGSDITSGAIRFTFGITELRDGVDIVALAIGVFALTEVVAQLENPETRSVSGSKISTLMPTRTDFRRMIPSSMRGTALGAICGALPGAGPSIASFGSYTLERWFSKYKDELGTGAIEGVAGPEAANNASAQCSFIPTLTLGVPGSATMALLLGVLIVHNIQPGPTVISSNPTLFWGLIASMWIGNLMLLVLNMPLIGVWVKLLSIPYAFLYPAIILFCCVGLYTTDYSVFSIYVAIFFGLFGYIIRKLEFEPAPIMLGFVLGPMMEQNFRTALLISRGDFLVFITKPISAGLLLLGAVMVFVMSRKAVRTAYKKIVVEEE